jgi:hypothetical protein
MSSEREQALRTLVEAWLSHRPVLEWHQEAKTEIELRRAEVLRPGRPGLLDLVAEVNGRLAHMVIGLRNSDDEPHVLRPGDDVVLGLLEDDDGLAVCVDALRDAQLAPLTLAVIGGSRPRSGPVAPLRDDEQATVLDCGDRGDLWVFPWLYDGPHPALPLAVGPPGPRLRPGAARRPLRGLGPGTHLTARSVRPRRPSRGGRR